MTYKITLSDGKERELQEFTLLMARHIQEKTGKNVGDAPVEELIFEGLVDKDGLTPESIAALIPLGKLMDLILIVLAAVTCRSIEEVKKAAENPPQPALAATVQ